MLGRVRDGERRGVACGEAALVERRAVVADEAALVAEIPQGIRRREAGLLRDLAEARGREAGVLRLDAPRDALPAGRFLRGAPQQEHARRIDRVDEDVDGAAFRHARGRIPNG